MVESCHAKEQAIGDLKPENMLVTVEPSAHPLAGLQTPRILLCDVEGFVPLPKVRMQS